MAKPIIRIDAKDLRQVGAIIIPLLLVLAIDYMFEDMFRSLDTLQQFGVLFALVIGTAWAYQTLVKRWIK